MTTLGHVHDNTVRFALIAPDLLDGFGQRALAPGRERGFRARGGQRSGKMAPEPTRGSSHEHMLCTEVKQSGHEVLLSCAAVEKQGRAWGLTVMGFSMDPQTIR
jgi:hypothetical protein